ncbi:Sodium/glucose cotransporter [subsurface metagenome]
MEYPIVFGMMMIYIIVTMVIAIALAKRVRSSDSFLIAARGLPWFLVTAVVTGAWIGGGSVIGVAQSGYTTGIAGCLYNVGMFIALTLFAFTLVKRYRRTGAITIPEMVKSFFGNKTGHVASVMIILAYSIIMITTLVSGGAVLSLVLGISQTWGIAISAILFVGITLAGGLVSISLTNFIHVVVLFLGLLMSAIFGLMKVGGWSGLSQALPASYFDFTGGVPHQLWTGDLVSVVIGFFAAQVVIIGILAGKDPEATAKGCFASAFLVLPLGIACVLLGMISRVIYGDALPYGLTAGPAAMVALNPWLGGFAICGIWAAIISSGPAIVLGLSQLFVQDYYVGIINPAAPDNKVLFYSRAITVVIGIITFVFALGFYEVLSGILWAFAIRAGVGLLIIMIAYLGMSRVNEKGAFWGLLCGLVVLIYWTIADRPWDIHEVYPMLGSVAVVTLIISAFTKRKASIPEHIRESFEITK